MSPLNDDARLLDPVPLVPADEPATAAGAVTPVPDTAMTVRAFLAEVATLLRGGLPSSVWIEGTVVAVKAGLHGHTIELVDPAPGGSPPQLRVFLPNSSRERIAGQFGLPIDPVLLIGMTTLLRVEPRFDPVWHLGGRVIGLARSAETSLRRRLLEKAVAALKRDGLWDRQRALPAPRDITRLVVLHPPASAGWADVGTRLSRWQAAGILAVRSVPVPFEGAGAAAGIVAALGEAITGAVEAVDVVAVVRGGGARAGLAVFDDPSVARAIALCPVPVITGIGHAVDDSLADRVAWRSTATPSLAVTLVGALIAAAARGAETDHADIMACAARQVVASGQTLAARLYLLDAAGQRRCAAAETELAACWSRVQVEMARARERLGRLGDSAAVLLRAVLTGAPALLSQQDGQLRRTVADGLDQACRLAGQHDGGAARFQAIGVSVRNQIDRQAGPLDNLQDSVLRGANRRLLEVEIDLARLAAVIDASDLNRALQRGFALVTDAAGRLLPTRARAMAAARVTLVFADGMLEAMPIAPRQEG